MLRSKITIIVMLGITGTAIGANWSYWAKLFGGESASVLTPPPLKAGPTLSPARGGAADDRGPGAAGSKTPREAPQHVVPGESGPSGHPSSPGSGPLAGTLPVPPAGSQGDTDVLPAVERLLAALRLAQASPEAPETPPRSPFHHEVEIIAGMSLEELVAEARQDRAARGQRQEDAAGAAAGPVSSPTPGASPEALVAAMPLTAILRGSSGSVCVLGGARLRTGDLVPGTPFRLVDIQDREIALGDGQTTLRKALTGLPPDPGRPERPRPDPSSTESSPAAPRTHQP